MKKIIFVALFAMASLCVTNVTAQTTKTKSDKAVAAEQIMETRLEMLKNELKLTDTQAVAFAPVYREYRKVLGRVTDNKTTRIKKDELTNENALKVVAARLANTINTSSVKQKYLWIFAEVIEPLQIEQLYRIDDRIAKEARKIVQYKK
jgi:hypothetical protein